jgi:hypothetical protein
MARDAKNSGDAPKVNAVDASPARDGRSRITRLGRWIAALAGVLLFFYGTVGYLRSADMFGDHPRWRGMTAAQRTLACAGTGRAAGDRFARAPRGARCSRRSSIHPFSPKQGTRRAFGRVLRRSSFPAAADFFEVIAVIADGAFTSGKDVSEDRVYLGPDMLPVVRWASRIAVPVLVIPE